MQAIEWLKLYAQNFGEKLTKITTLLNTNFDLYIHTFADTYWDLCATWWKLGYLEKLRFHFWWLAIHMKMSIKFSPSKVLIKKLIRYLLPCILCFTWVFFFNLDSVIGLTATRQWPLKSLWMGLRHATRQDHTVLNQIGKKHYVCSYSQNICLGCEKLYRFYSFIPCLSIIIYYII